MQSQARMGWNDYIRGMTSTIAIARWFFTARLSLSRLVVEEQVIALSLTPRGEWLNRQFFRPKTDLTVSCDARLCIIMRPARKESLTLVLVVAISGNLPVRIDPPCDSGDGPWAIDGRERRARTKEGVETKVAAHISPNNLSLVINAIRGCFVGHRFWDIK